MQIINRHSPKPVGAIRNGDIFTLSAPGRRPATRALLSWLTQPLTNWTRLDMLRGLYEQLPATTTPQEFYEQMLHALQVQWQLPDDDRQRLPVSGPIVMVANHPFGAAEGMILGAIALSVRPDFKFMANYLLARIPEIRETIIAVDPFGGAQAGRRNLAPLRECLKWLQAGGVLGIFPAGEVAHLQIRRRLGVTDPDGQFHAGAAFDEESFHGFGV